MNLSFKGSISIKEITLAGIFAAITAAMAQIAIQAPFSVVPVTLQTLAVFLSASILGSRGAFFSQVTYILIGAVGLPVFAGFEGGWHVLIGPKGGYIWSFPVMALLIGAILENKKNPSRMDMVGTMIIGIILCYAIGTTQLTLVSRLTYVKAITAGIVPFVPFDILKIIAASFIGYEVRNALIRANLIKA